MPGLRKSESAKSIAAILMVATLVAIYVTVVLASSGRTGFTRPLAQAELT
jgi:hypothetical protein